MPLQFKIQLATSVNLEEIASIIRQTSKWLKSKGILQWNEDFQASRLEDEFFNDELFVVLDQSQRIIGTLSLSKRKNGFWRDDSLTNSLPSIYLHRVAISREFAGRKLGAGIIEWAKEFAQERDFALLRLECDKTNPYLPGFYRDCGFDYIGEIFHSPWQMTFSLFEMKLRAATSS